MYTASYLPQRWSQTSLTLLCFETLSTWSCKCFWSPEMGISLKAWHVEGTWEEAGQLRYEHSDTQRTQMERFEQGIHLLQLVEIFLSLKFSSKRLRFFSFDGSAWCCDYRMTMRWLWQSPRRRMIWLWLVLCLLCGCFSCDILEVSRFLFLALCFLCETWDALGRSGTLWTLPRLGPFGRSSQWSRRNATGGWASTWEVTTDATCDILQTFCS